MAWSEWQTMMTRRATTSDLRSRLLTWHVAEIYEKHITSSGLLEDNPIYMKSSGSFPKSSNDSSYTFVSVFPAFTAPSAGFAGFFFFPPSFASFCFSLASAVNPLAVFRMSTSRRGRASSRTCCSMKVAYSGLFSRRLKRVSMTCLE